MYPDRRRSTPPNYKTPPYVTAEPEVVHYKRDKSDEFMILACDGLWDEMTSQQSVEIVSDLVKTKSFENFATSLIKAGLSDPNNHRSVNMERIQHHLSIPPPKCRRYRDDMTVNVLFLEPIVEMPESSFELMEVPEKQTPTAPQLEKWIKFVGSKTFPKL